MAGCTNIRTLCSLLLAVVVSLVLYNVYLYHSNLYEPTLFPVASRTELLENNLSTGQADELFELNFVDRSKESTQRLLSTQEHSNKKFSAINKTTVLVKDVLQNQTLHSADNASRTQKTSAYTSTDSGVEKRGYILALKIYEQQTMATGNLLQLQCFGSKLNLEVVQPLIQDSTLSTPLDYTQHTDMLRLEDLYDMQEWRRHADNERFVPLVKWEEFMAHTSKNIVLVQMKYPTLTFLKSARKKGTTERKVAYQEGCGYKVVSKAFAKLEKKNFNVIRRVCFNFLSGEYIPLEVFQRELLQGHAPNNVTVIIDEWRGFGENQRVLIKDKICPDAQNYRDHTHSSSKVTRDAQLYIKKYLQRSKTAAGYLAVIARYEMTALTCRKHNHSDPHAIIPFCLEETMKQIYLTKKETKLTEIFLSSDLGKYGSRSFLRHNYYDHQQEMEAFVGKVYGNKLTIREWERTFEETAESRDAGYIALVQQAIVARARCVLFVGGGTFQRHTLHLYNELHPDHQSERCVRVIERCTSNSRPVLE